VTHPILELTAVVKSYGGLRPLRIERFALTPGEDVAIVGMDATMAEVFVNLITGLSLPDQGVVRAFDRPTAEIQDGEAWLAGADRFGLVSERAVLLEALSIVQNLAMAFSLEIEPPRPEVELQASALADEAGIAESDRSRRVGELTPLARAQVRLARALAFDPEILIVEHPSSGIPRSDIGHLAHQIRHTAAARGVAVLTLTADSDFATKVASRVLTLEQATGRLRPAGRRWFARH
jgi:ABC-type transporter Mla maintaining outer membrane lipid asymmetry ATPase subunit MlaF